MKMVNNPGQIVVDFEIDAETVFLVIRNTAVLPALNLKIKPSSIILGLGGRKNIGELSIFKEIRYLAPLKEIKIFVDSYESFFLHLKDTLVSFTISYKGENNKSYKSKIVHDLKIYSDLIFFIKKY